MRRLAAVVLIVLGLAILLGRGRAIATAVFGKSSTTTSSITESITSIVVNGGNGDVHVKEGSSTTVQRTEHWLFTRPHVSIKQSGGVLTVSATCPSGAFNRCWVDFVATVPSDTRATVVTSNGDVGVSGLAGPGVGVRTNNGDVDLSNLTTKFAKVRTRNGDVRLDHVRTPLEIQTDNGDVSGSLDDHGSLDITTSNGDVDLSVPAGSYNADIDTHNGDVHKHGFTEDSSSPDRLKIRTNNGDVTVDGRSS